MFLTLKLYGLQNLMSKVTKQTYVISTKIIIFIAFMTFKFAVKLLTSLFEQLSNIQLLFM